MRCGRRPGFRWDSPISGPTGAGPVSGGVHSTGAAVSPPTRCGSSTSAGMPSAASRMGVGALPGAFPGKGGGGGPGLPKTRGNRRSDALLRSRTGEGVPPSVNYKLEMRQKSGCRPEMSNRDSFWGAKPERGETTLIGINILGQLLTSLRDELRRQKGYTGKTVTRYLTGVKTNTLVRNGKPVS